MKTRRHSWVSTAWTFGLILLIAPFSRAEIPLAYSEIFNVYGDPELPPNGNIYLNGSSMPVWHVSSIKEYEDYLTAHPGPVEFHKSGLVVSIQQVGRDGKIGLMQFQRKDLMNELEIESWLDQLSSSEKWVAKGEKIWILPTAGAYALWDGNGKLVVTDRAPKPGR